MSNRDIRQYADIDPQSKSTLDTAASRLGISARSYMKVVKVACTIADLEQHSTISTAHIAGALQYRRQEVVLTL